MYGFLQTGSGVEDMRSQASWTLQSSCMPPRSNRQSSLDKCFKKHELEKRTCGPRGRDVEHASFSSLGFFLGQLPEKQQPQASTKDSLLSLPTNRINPMV